MNSLNAIKKIRKIRQNICEMALFKARAELLAQETEFLALEDAFKALLSERAGHQRYFFQITSLNHSVIFNHQSYLKRNSQLEDGLRASMKNQQEHIRLAFSRVKEAEHDLLNAKRDFLTIEKLLLAQSYKELKQELKKAENDNDDQNATRYCLKRVEHER